MLDKLYQPSLIESVVKLPDVGIEPPVHPPRSDRNRQRVQCLVRTTPWSESVGKAQEVLFVDRVQHLDRGTLDDLILQRGNPEWAKLTRFTHFRDVNPTHGPGSVRSSLESKGEVLKVRLEGLAVVLPRLAIDACCSILLSGQIGCPQSFHVVNVVQERSEPLLLILSCCLTYPLARALRAFPARTAHQEARGRVPLGPLPSLRRLRCRSLGVVRRLRRFYGTVRLPASVRHRDRKSTRLNSSHRCISYAVFCLKKKTK